jgi:hypothetical protein
MTLARLEANRLSAKKSTGPRTAAGKAYSRMNALRHGARSAEYMNLVKALCDAEPGAILRVGEGCLAAAEKTHPVYLQLIELFTEVERQMVEPSYARKWTSKKMKKK